jgi:hypothetical protein
VTNSFKGSNESYTQYIAASCLIGTIGPRLSPTRPLSILGSSGGVSESTHCTTTTTLLWCISRRERRLEEANTSFSSFFLAEKRVKRNQVEEGRKRKKDEL